MGLPVNLEGSYTLFIDLINSILKFVKGVLRSWFDCDLIRRNKRSDCDIRRVDMTAGIKIAF